MDQSIVMWVVGGLITGIFTISQLVIGRIMSGYDKEIKSLKTCNKEMKVRQVAAETLDAEKNSVIAAQGKRLEAALAEISSLQISFHRVDKEVTALRTENGAIKKSLDEIKENIKAVFDLIRNQKGS